MSVFMPAGGGLAPGLSLRVPGVPTRINVQYFFDRKAVKDALDDATYWGLYRSGSIVMQMARRSIRQMGYAKPKLKAMKDNPGVPLRTLLNDPRIPNRSKTKIRERLFEIATRPPSAPGTPPHTHTNVFRRDIVYAYDPTSKSVVVGQHMNGGAWLAALHEFGGAMQMQAWAWVPKYPRSYTKGILSWYMVGRGPRNRERWTPTKWTQTFRYPSRPYMEPAIRRAVSEREIVRQFANRFRVGGG